MPWYVFRVNPPGNVSNPTDYLLISHRPYSVGNEVLHAIKAMDNGFGFPILSHALMCEIATALNNKENSSNILLRGI